MISILEIQGTDLYRKQSDPESAERFVSAVHGGPGACPPRSQRLYDIALVGAAGFDAFSSILWDKVASRQVRTQDDRERLTAGQTAGRASYRTARGAHLPAAKANPEEGPGRGGVAVAAPAGGSREAGGRWQAQKLNRQPCVQGRQFENRKTFSFTAISTVVNPTS